MTVCLSFHLFQVIHEKQSSNIYKSNCDNKIKTTTTTTTKTTTTTTTKTTTITTTTTKNNNNNNRNFVIAPPNDPVAEEAVVEIDLFGFLVKVLKSFEAIFCPRDG